MKISINGLLKGSIQVGSTMVAAAHFTQTDTLIHANRAIPF